MTEAFIGFEWRMCRAQKSKWRGTYTSSLLDECENLEEREARLGIPPGQPFLLRPDGSADRDVVLYFNSSSFRRLATDSQTSYASDLKVFLSFLEGHGTNWRDATHDTLLDYEFWRRREAQNPRKVSGAKFARELAACSHFYRWQLVRGNVALSPVHTATSISRRGDSVSRAVLQPTNIRSVKVKWLTPRAYRRWRDVGLGGCGADGLLQDSWRGRNDGRNMAMADLMWASGLRLREAGSILIDELPSHAPDNQYVRGRLGEAVAKGPSREFWVSRKALQSINGYLISTRAAAVRRARAAGRYDQIDDMRIVTAVSGRGTIDYVDVGGRPARTSLDALSASDRLKLFRHTSSGLEPAALWLTEGGMPMPYLTWEAVFATASARCKKLGVPISCHPHMLRHSFALRMLMTLTYAFDRRLGLSESERNEYRHLFGDPWVLVQTMLGHSSLTTTRSYYLEPVQGLQIDMFLNGDNDEDSLEGILARVASTSPRILDDAR